MDDLAGFHTFHLGFCETEPHKVVHALAPSIDEIDSFQSFSKNNSVNTNKSSVFINEGKGKNFLYNSCINDNIPYKTKRTELNIERLKKINDKNNIIRLFELLDKFSLYELEDFEN